MNKTTAQIPASQALNEYGEYVSGRDAHMKITPISTWVSGEVGDFFGQMFSTVTTSLDVVRVWTCDGVTHWTLEKWTHDNGYQCELVVLSKAEFLALIRE